MVVVEDPIAWAVLVLTQGRCYPSEFLAGSPDLFRNWWRQSIAALGLEPAVWRPYGLRRGGASHHYRLGGDLQATVFKGRWSSMTTARIYIVEAMSILAREQLDVAEHPLGKSWLAHLHSVLSQFAL